jgi:hypothetical protein
MPIRVDTSGDTAVICISGVTPPDEAEELLALLRAYPGAALDLSGVEHLHTALLQLVSAADAPVVAWPEDRFWRRCLEGTTEEKQ